MLEERVDQIWEWINGGPSKRYEDSARGQLHHILQAMNTADKLADLLKEVREERNRQWTRAQKIGLFVFAGAAAAAPYVVLALHH